MIINCTNCHTKYNINPSLIDNNGRKVKCIKCQNIWLVLPNEEQNSKPLKDKDIESKPFNYIKKIPNKKHENNQNFSFLVSGILLILILLFSVFLFKDRITSYYPRTQKIYDKLGYNNISGLSLENVQVNKFVDNDKIFLIIHASIKNNSSKEQNTPHLLVLLTDKNKKEQYKKLIKTDQKLKPGELHPLEELIFLIDDHSDQLALELVNDIQLFLR